MKNAEIIQNNKFNQCQKYCINQNNLQLITFIKKMSLNNKKINIKKYKKVQIKINLVIKMDKKILINSNYNHLCKKIIRIKTHQNKIQFKK